MHENYFTILGGVISGLITWGAMVSIDNQAKKRWAKEFFQKEKIRILIELRSILARTEIELIDFSTDYLKYCLCLTDSSPKVCVDFGDNPEELFTKRIRLIMSAMDSINYQIEPYIKNTKINKEKIKGFLLKSKFLYEQLLGFINHGLETIPKEYQSKIYATVWRNDIAKSGSGMVCDMEYAKYLFDTYSRFGKEHKRLEYNENNINEINANIKTYLKPILEEIDSCINP